ncbi:MAG TPA: hypothetical protein VNY06_03510, partial [Methylocella sp.]|nr:hypothetical protein [Methylocella sp.]
KKHLLLPWKSKRGDLHATDHPYLATISRPSDATTLAVRPRRRGPPAPQASLVFRDKHFL